MATGTASYRGELIEVDFSAAGEVTDYGVDRSPTFIEWGGIEIETITICGVTVAEGDLPVELAQALYDLHEELEFETDDL